jgi:hypothetical protein
MENEILNHSGKDNDMTNIWRNQPMESAEISLAEICRRANKFEKQIFWRNLREYVAGAIVIAFFGYYISIFHTALTRAGCGLVIAGTLFIGLALHKRGQSKALPTDLAIRSCTEFLSKELQRQRDLLRGVWSWYLLPLVPGLFVFQAGLLEQALKQPNASSRVGAIVIPFAIALVLSAIVFVGIGSLNQSAARKLQREIDALEGMEKES